MNTITIAFKFTDCNDDSTEHSNHFIFDSLIIDFRNVDETIRYKVKDILRDHDFTDSELLTKGVYEYDCFCELDSDLWIKSNITELVRDRLKSVYKDLISAKIPVAMDKYTYDYIIDDLLPLVKIGDINCKWVKNIDKLYLSKFIYNSANWEYDPEEKEIIEKGITVYNA